jgi:DNA-binding MarR family transcriptional regulator
VAAKRHPAAGRAGKAEQSLTRENLGFLLAKASQHWNELLHERFAAAGFPEVRPAYGSLLLPLYEEDGLRQGELARRARLSKQTLTTMARALERDGLIERRADPLDARATLLYLTPRAQAFRAVAEKILAVLDELVAQTLPRRSSRELKEALQAILGLGHRGTQDND